jgi:predicted transcriptional regulator of viral defense system
MHSLYVDGDRHSRIINKKIRWGSRAARLIRRRGIVGTGDLERLAIPRTYLSRLVRRGDLQQLGRGLYAVSDYGTTALVSLAEVATSVPSGVVCLLSALACHNLGTQLPHQVWIAIGPKARAPKRVSVQLRIVRMSGQALTAGIQTHRIERVPVRVYSKAKTVVDCFKFRNKIGLDVAVEALRDYRRKRGNMDDLWRYARICRVSRVMQPYLQAVA